MQRIIQSCVLFLWIHTLTSVKSQECSLGQFKTGPMYDTNFDTANLQHLYSTGSKVRVACVVGYRGLFTMICVEGEWVYRGTKCQPVSCPMIHVDNNVQVNGDTQEATYGNRVRFSCRSNAEVLIGSAEMRCDENGEWAGDLPRCEAVKCAVPIIENGYVPGGLRAQRVYDEHEILHFLCNRAYIRTEDRPSRCTKVGGKPEFIPTPACESIKCKLGLRLPEGTTYDPAFRNVFLPDEKLRIRCGDKYYFSHPRETSAEITCKDDGKWTATPICREVTCDLHDPLVRFWRFPRGPVKLGQTTPYMCRPGYRTTHVQATCTRDGWIPNPLCKASFSNCKAPPKVENADVVTSHREEYLPGSRVTYQCHDNYTMEGGNTLRCRDGEWGEGNITCSRGCGAPPILEDGDIKHTMKSQYNHSERVEYQCPLYYTMEGEPYRTCINGEWTGYMRCLKPCVANEDDFGQHNITLKSPDKRFFAHDEMMEFRCARGRPVGALAMRQRCNSGVIHLPTCH